MPRTIAFFRSQSASYLLSSYLLLLLTSPLFLRCFLLFLSRTSKFIPSVFLFRFLLQRSSSLSFFFSRARYSEKRACACRGPEFLPSVQGNAFAAIFQAKGISRGAQMVLAMCQPLRRSSTLIALFFEQLYERTDRSIMPGVRVPCSLC